MASNILTSNQRTISRYQIVDDRYEQTWQEVDGLAVLDAEDAEAGADDEDTTDDASLALSLSMRPDRSRRVPMIPPMARLRMKRTGYSLLAILGRVALAPSTRQQSPRALKSEVLYLSPMPERTRAPKVPPMRMVQVLTIVPNMACSIRFRPSAP